MFNYGVGCLRTVVFIDGQNLYHSAKDAWRPQPPVGSSIYSWPSYDVEKLANTLVSADPSRVLTQIRFYTGVPDPGLGPTQKHWHSFWSSKLRYLKSRGIITYKGRINMNGQEKGVDVHLAIDLIQLTYEQQYEVAMIISQDWDFGPAIRLAKEIAKDQGRSLIFESHFPLGSGSDCDRGIPGTDWKPIDKAIYDACLESRSY